jgi:hypothetical protein
MKVALLWAKTKVFIEFARKGERIMDAGILDKLEACYGHELSLVAEDFETLEITLIAE